MRRGPGSLRRDSGCDICHIDIAELERAYAAGA